MKFYLVLILTIAASGYAMNPEFLKIQSDFNQLTDANKKLSRENLTQLKTLTTSIALYCESRQRNIQHLRTPATATSSNMEYSKNDVVDKEAQMLAHFQAVLKSRMTEIEKESSNLLKQTESLTGQGNSFKRGIKNNTGNNRTRFVWLADFCSCTLV